MAHLAERLPVTLDGTSYLIDIDQYRRTTVPLLREQQDTSDDAGETTLNTTLWVRAQTDWSLGAGQEFFDNADSDRRKFWSSSGIDPWTKGKVSLLPICESKNNANVWTSVIAKQIGTYLYVASGTDLFYTADASVADGSVSWSTVTALASPQTITDFTSDGTTVWIAYGSSRALASTTVGATTQPSTLGALTPDLVRVVGNRLLGFDGGRVVEIDAAGGAWGHRSITRSRMAAHGSVDVPAPPASTSQRTSTRQGHCSTFRSSHLMGCWMIRSRSLIFLEAKASTTSCRTAGWF